MAASKRLSVAGATVDSAITSWIAWEMEDVAGGVRMFRSMRHWSFARSVLSVVSLERMVWACARRAVMVAEEGLGWWRCGGVYVYCIYSRGVLVEMEVDSSHSSGLWNDVAGFGICVMDSHS